MVYTDNALNILTAMSYRGIKRGWVVNNLKGNEDEWSIVELLNKKLTHHTSVEEFLERKKIVEVRINNLSNCDGVVALGDENFPTLKYIIKGSDFPVCLFYKGDISLLNNTLNVAVIGLLNPTDEIVTREEKLVEEILKCNANIVSGLALGCDTIAHKVALKHNKKTIAILPNDLDNILPKENIKLSEEIVEKGGLLVSEYYESFSNIRELTSRYIERDRLQAIFSDVVILAASYSKDSLLLHPYLKGKKLDSGARHALLNALKYNIPIGVMYNEKLDKNNPMFDLNREFINKGAIILTKRSLNNLICKNNSPSIQKTLF